MRGREVEEKNYRKKKNGWLHMTPSKSRWLSPCNLRVIHVYSQVREKCSWSLWPCVCAKRQFTTASSGPSWSGLSTFAEFLPNWVSMSSYVPPQIIQSTGFNFQLSAPDKGLGDWLPKTGNYMSYPPTRPLDKTSRPWIAIKMTTLALGAARDVYPSLDPRRLGLIQQQRPTTEMNIMNAETEQGPKNSQRNMNIMSSQPKLSSKATMANPPRKLFLDGYSVRECQPKVTTLALGAAKDV